MHTTLPPRIKKSIDLYYLPLFHFAVRLCGNPVDAMILTQRTIHLAFERCLEFPVPADAGAWLFAMLFHRFLEERPRSRDSMGTDFQPIASNGLKLA